MLQERLSHLELLGCGLVLVAILMTINFDNYDSDSGSGEVQLSDVTDLDNTSHGLPSDESSTLLINHRTNNNDRYLTSVSINVYPNLSIEKEIQHSNDVICSSYNT